MSESESNNGAGLRGAPRRQLTLFDSTCIIVGIIIGVGIYETSPLIAGCVPEAGELLFKPDGWSLEYRWIPALLQQLLQPVPGVVWLVGVWVLGGLFSLVGALCYAELATAYPKAGGDYVYLTRSYGRPVGFLFAWAQFWVVRPGSIGAFAYVFARYANRLWPLPTGVHQYVAFLGYPVGSPVFARYANQIWPLAAGEHEYLPFLAYAVASVVILSGINILGVRQGKWTQNVLTAAKVLGLGAIVVLGLLFAAEGAAPTRAPRVPGAYSIGLAMIFVLFTYGGWNEMAYVGAEVRNPRRNILRALVLGTVAVTVVYVLVTLAFVHALGFQGTCESRAPAAEVLRLGLGKWGDRAISVLICISALGAINGMVFTGARIYYAMGTEHRLYAWVGRWNRRLGTPLRSLLAQAAITLALVVGFGLTESGFESMVKFTTPVFWVFFLLAGVSLFVLRYREPDTPRPYRVPWYPLIPIVFCLSSVYMLYASLSYAIENRTYEALWSVGLLVVGLALVWYDPPVQRRGPPELV